LETPLNVAVYSHLNWEKAKKFEWTLLQVHLLPLTVSLEIMSYYFSEVDGQPLPSLQHEALAVEGHILLVKCDQGGDKALFAQILMELTKLYELKETPRTFTQPPFGQTWSFIYTTSKKLLPFDLHTFYQSKGLIPVKRKPKFEPHM
jgi:hypothetical protein